MSSTFSMRGVFSLSLGTVVTRAFALATQLVLVFWLSPEEFGYWAAAASAMALLTGLINFGEVNGYLANQGITLHRTRRSILRLNSLLVVIGLMVAGAYLYAGEPRVAALSLLIVVSIPVQGDADLLYAAGVRSRQYSLLIWAQAMAAVLKLLVAVAIAVWSESAIALAISALAYYVVLDMVIHSRLRRDGADRAEPAPTPHVRQRFSWAVNSLMMTIPLQVAYLVSQFLASPEVLGILYLAFQITLGISGLISQPLARVSLSVFAALQGGDRTKAAMTFMHVFSAGMAIIVAFGVLILPWSEPWIGQEWALAVPATMALLISLTARIVAPVIDGFQQSSGRWWQATLFNTVDAIGTGLAACTAVFNDVVLLALAVSAWKVMFGLGRFCIVMNDASVGTRLVFGFLTFVMSAGGFVAVLSPDDVRVSLASVLLLGSMAWFLASLRKQRQQVISMGRM
ncbi:oligosaccharide flippase family protein [Kocuria kalidii]|uniref:lipopolysaccharide biosynthesis protein n=1 Tax=Kocuria kalidii TaxID=3376283 RepID=UPI00378A14E5